MSFDLTPRQEDILRATVDHYVSTAEPVGSKVLARNYSLEISPATIRNVMAVLERTGLLFQPHTSAGRIPSDSGYRHYVDQLIQPSGAIAQQIHQLLTERLQPQKGSLESLLRQAAQILAQCSGCLTLLTLPQATQLNIRHVQLMPVEPRRMMLIVVTDDYSTHSAIIEPDPPENQDSDICWENLEQELSILSNFLDHHLCGCSIADLNKIDWFELGHEFEIYTHFLQKVGEAIAQELQPQDHPQVIMGGLSKVLQQPEFSELKQAHTLIQLFDLQNADLWPLMWSSPSDNASNTTHSATEGTQITIKIGTENPLEPIQTCAMISSTYTHRMFSQGRVSVIGPTRMAYEKVIGLVDGTSQYLTQVFCL